VAFGLPLALAATCALLIRLELVSLLAPLFGPWAGVLYGHHECTLARSVPLTATLVALGIAALAGAVFLRGAWRTAFVGAGAVWAVAWELAALLSVVNTTV
jgi:hypothetical protein